MFFKIKTAYQETTFGPKRNDVTGELRKFHNEELHDLYSPTIVRVIKSRRMIWAVHVVLMEEGRGLYRVLVGKPKEKRPLGRPGWRSDGMDWIELTQDESGGRHL
jgi:hypothetical protein